MDNNLHIAWKGGCVAMRMLGLSLPTVEKSWIDRINLRRVAAALAGRWRARLDRYRKWRRYLATVRELEALDDHTLRDIGILRGQIEIHARALAYGDETADLRHAAARGATPANDNRKAPRERIGRALAKSA